MKCKKCGYDNRKEVKFCEECGANLQAPAGTSPSPAATPRQKVVKVQKDKKPRLNLIWPLMILLLMTFCCLMLLFEQVEVPGFAAPYLNPVIENVREALPAFFGGAKTDEEGVKGEDQVEKVTTISCEEFSDKLKEADLSQDTICHDDTNECYTDIHDLGLFKNIEVTYSWDDAPKAPASCEDRGTYMRCYFPRDGQVDRVDYWISIGECTEGLGYSDGWLVEEEDEVLEEEDTADCCKLSNVKKVGMEITNKFILVFDLECEGAWPVGDGECISGETYVGEDQDIFWTDVTCCIDPDVNDVLHCESDGHVDQKVSWTRVELSHGECTWESPKFYSPPYVEGPDSHDGSRGSDCPAGEALCAGTCCTYGHCCDWGYGTDCYTVCP